jgi:hypothetical protein
MDNHHTKESSFGLLAHLLRHLFQELAHCITLQRDSVPLTRPFSDRVFLREFLDGWIFGEDHFFVVVQVFIDTADHLFRYGLGMLEPILAVKLIFLILLGCLVDLLLQVPLASLGFLVIDHYFRSIF